MCQRVQPLQLSPLLLVLLVLLVEQELVLMPPYPIVTRQCCAMSSLPRTG